MSHNMCVCGNPVCFVSTGIHGGITFGSGNLDDYGYWEKPCRVCAEAYDKNKENRMKELIAEYGPAPKDDPDRYAWATLPAWPYPLDIQGKTKTIITVEIYFGYYLGDTQMWDTLFVEIPADTTNDQYEKVALSLADFGDSHIAFTGLLSVNIEDIDEDDEDELSTE